MPVTVPDYLSDSTQYRWNSAAGQYIDKSGRFVPRALVREELDNVLDGISAKVDIASRALVSGTIDINEWLDTMTDLVKRSHLVSAAAQRGGWAQMSPADFGRVGRIVRDQYSYLRTFAEQIESGKQPLDGNLIRRAALYAQAGRDTFYVFQRLEMRQRGYNVVTSVRNATDSCEDCIALDGVSYTWNEGTTQYENKSAAIKVYKPIGRRICNKNCRCSESYTNEAGDEVTV